MVNLAISSSSTFALFEFSFDVDMLGVESATTAGMSRREGEEGKMREKCVGIYYY